MPRLSLAFSLCVALVGVIVGVSGQNAFVPLHRVAGERNAPASQSGTGRDDIGDRDVRTGKAFLAAKSDDKDDDDCDEVDVSDDDDDLFLNQKFKSGYIHVGRKDGEMFYWMFDARKDAHAKPLIVWLTGGPGCSSEMAALSENGPFWVEDNATLSYNEHSWTEIGTVLYIDQPLGTGFSEASDPHNYVTNEDQVADHMHQFFTKFIAKYPQFVDRPFYITGESYAGHYIPAIAHNLLDSPIKGLNLKGIAIGNGWVDPYIQYPAYAEFAYENKLVGKDAYERAKRGLEICDRSIKAGAWSVALVQCGGVVNGLLGKLNPYDIRLSCEVPPLCYNQTSLNNFLNEDKVKKAIGARGNWESCDQLVHSHLLDEWITTMRGKFTKILSDKVDVLVYNGDQDFICNWKGGLDWVNVIDWPGQKKFSKMELSPWKVGGKTAGEVKNVDNLTFLKVHGAGHMVPMDQPASALAMLKKFVDRSSGHNDSRLVEG